MLKEINKKKVIQPDLAITEVKRHCRKVDFHSFDLKDLDPDKVDIEKIKEASTIIIKKVMKSVKSAKLTLIEWTVTEYENAGSSRIFILLDGEEVPFEVPAL